MNLGSYSVLSLADARKTAKELRARVALGYDVAGDMFYYAIKRHMVQHNPVSAFDLSDAGGKEEGRERALSRDELVLLFEAMRTTKGFSRENLLAVKLLLLLAVRKQELTAARWEEFDLDKAVWSLPAERTKHQDQSGHRHSPTRPRRGSLARSSPVGVRFRVGFPDAEGPTPDDSPYP